MASIFPKSSHPGFSSSNKDMVMDKDMKSDLTARRLKKHAGLTFRPTDDLRSHLKLNVNTGEVLIYHHTAFLKEQLRMTKGKTSGTSFGESLKLGTLPRQLALECLDSIQKILFPLSDSKSRSLLASYVTSSSFDPDCLRFDSSYIRTKDELDISYEYFGMQLAALYTELEYPTPRGWAEKWLERKSGARYVMMATLVGVIIAIILGTASLGVGAYQAWIAYQQWQIPITPS